MDVGAVSGTPSNHFVVAVHIVDTDPVVMGSNSKPVSIRGVLHYFIPLLGISEGLDDIVDVVVISSDGDLSFVIGDSDVTVVGVDCACSGALVWRESGQCGRTTNLLLLSSLLIYSSLSNSTSLFHIPDTNLIIITTSDNNIGQRGMNTQAPYFPIGVTSHQNILLLPIVVILIDHAISSPN